MHRAAATGAAGRFVAAALWRATDPRDAGKALLYAPNKVPDAKSACDMDGQNVLETGICSKLWNILMAASYIVISFHKR